MGATANTVCKCMAKQRYESWGDAERAAATMRGVNARNGVAEPMVAYRCPLCGGIHVGRRVRRGGGPGNRAPDAGRRPRIEDLGRRTAR